MIIPAYRTVAIRCPECGKMDFYALSRFSMSGTNIASIDCECGANLLKMGRNKGKNYWMQVKCSMCEGSHFYTFNYKELWMGNLLTLTCEDTGVEIGFIGAREPVRKNVQNMDKSVQEMAEELGYGDFFNNPEIMYRVLEHLHSLAGTGHLYCDCCNQNLEVEVYPDRIELHCNECGATGIVFAESFKDWENVRHLTEVVLSKGSFKYFDDKKTKKPRNRIKK
jgi:ribosomal protein S27E